MTKREREFISVVWKHYKDSGRHDLPWRHTTDPYVIVVSEIMLQQTQVERVIPKFNLFIEKWPNAQALADVSLGEVLTIWQGLGYNRRAKMLHECAQVITKKYRGRWPTTYEEILTLPGIGPYTAGAVMAFAYNQGVSIIETNIRSVFLHHFFTNKTKVSDTDIMALVQKTLPKDNPREWYWALMDYGSHIKKVFGNPNTKSRTYTKQSTFKGSDREIRGAIIRMLSESPATKAGLVKNLEDFKESRLVEQLDKLLHEHMIVKKGRSFSLPD